MKTEIVKLYKIKNNPNNPRLIKDDKFHKLVKSIKEFPEMLKLRPIVVNDELVVLGGNMRKKACKEAGLKEVPIIKASELSVKKQREFIIKDNVGFGEWDWDLIANEWDSTDLDNWGLDSWQNMDDIETSNEFSLPSGDKEPFQQMTFTLADEQAEQVRNSIEDIKRTEEYKYCETMGNDNSNGNALYLIIMQWAEQRK
ncbi:MAG: hypothetical protein CBD69_005845 [Crocinitomicaceae bacterium TMED209]|nr:MAG: hypothetical protein CBD69_005845 [Crocinitomicaceae bacterium TMED209]|tara:strand:- start:1142 stop:1738 length:597 start_codon:yes stop_codon:yes gene_type:complete